MLYYKDTFFYKSMPLDKNEFHDLHEAKNSSETERGLKFPVESTEAIQKTTNGIADMANAVLHDTPVSQEQVSKTKNTLKNLTFTYDEREKEALLTPLWPKLEESYAHMKDTLESYGYQEYLAQLPSTEGLRAYVLKLTPVQLHAISKMGKPTVLVCTPDTLEEKKNKLDTKKKYKNQGDTYFEKLTTDKLWGTPPTKLTISIIDGQSEMPQLPEQMVKKNWGERYTYMQKEYKKQGLKMISASQYANFAMERLRACEKSKDSEEEIIDSNTVTAFEGDLTKIQKIPFGSWISLNREFNFLWNSPEPGGAYLRFRPAVEVYV